MLAHSAKDSILCLTLIGAVVLLSCVRAGTQRRRTPYRLKGMYSHEIKTNVRGKSVILRRYLRLSGSAAAPQVTLEEERMGYALNGFSCSGSSSFSTSFTATFPEAAVRDGVLYLGAPEVRAKPNPCNESPDLSGISLTLLSQHRIGFQQKGRRVFFHLLSPQGTWRWSRLTPLGPGEGARGPGDTKLELEEWTLRLKRPGELVGHYDRIVVRKSNSINYTCNGAKEIWFFARYRVKGKITPRGKITLREISVVLPRHEKCEPSRQRYLDRMEGVLVGDTIHLKSVQDKVEQTLKRDYGVRSDQKENTYEDHKRVHRKNP